MKRLFNKILLWLYIRFNTILINIGIVLVRTENEILSTTQTDVQKYKYEQRKKYNNAFIEMLISGVKNDILVQEYYELLKKADKFMRKSTARQIAAAADKHLRFEGQDYSNNNGTEVKDKYGRRYSHFGFFDDTHKHAGKTLGEVLELELKERRTKDDEYEILYIFNNKPVEIGFSKILDITKNVENESVIKSDAAIIHQTVDYVDENEREMVDVFTKSKQFEFPIKVYREKENVVNKIEQLAEFLHVKKIAFEKRQLEFFIPLKFKIDKIENNSEIFEEITNINSIFVKDEYGEMIGFRIDKFVKRINYNNTHEVWKFEGIEMESVKI